MVIAAAKIKTAAPTKTTKNAIEGKSTTDLSETNSNKPITTKKIKRESVSEIQKHYDNIKEILHWSNATPIRCFGDIGYMCCYCNEQFPNPADLKSHTLLSHVGITNASFTKKRDMTGFYLKVDITDLFCNICSQDMDDLDTLMKHLIAEHSVKLHTDIKNHMLAFKFKGDELRCYVCHNEYTKFKMLIEHMSSVHNRNFICDVCDAGFVTKRKVVTHATEHRIGTFECSYCDKVFVTFKKQKSHEVRVHNRPNGYKCGYCDSTFRFYSHKQRHLVEEHGAQLPLIKCNACPKEFSSRPAYNIHVKRDHLLIKNHPCEVCDMTFYSATVLKHHMTTHTRVKGFECAICLKSYSRQTTLRQHLRIHADERRFKCGTCGAAFVQKCTWRAHMRARHGESV